MFHEIHKVTLLSWSYASGSIEKELMISSKYVYTDSWYVYSLCNEFTHSELFSCEYVKFGDVKHKNITSVWLKKSL